MGLSIVSLIIGIAGLASAVIAILNNNALKKRFNEALGGQHDSLESTLISTFNRANEIDSDIKELRNFYEELATKTSLASQKISIVRFNPFGDTGGDQSFALAILDAHNSGYVLSSIHGRQGTRVYVKPIDYGKSKYTLSSEEQQAINQAIKRSL